MHVHSHSHTHGGHADDLPQDGTGHELSHQPRQIARRAKEARRLWATFSLSLLTMVVEAVGGWLTHSLALLSDAGHMLTDASAIGLSMLALWFAARPANAKKSYGYYRLEILAALTNGVTLIVISLVIGWEAIVRLRTPTEVQVVPMAVVALFGVVASGVGVFWLGESHNLNVRGVWLHLMGDLLASAGVLVAAGVMWLTGWYRIDPLISIVVSGIILVTSYGLVKEAIDVLLEAAPSHLDLAAMETAIREVPRVKAVHDLHVWTIATGMYALSAHVVVERASCADSDAILRQVKAELAHQFHVDHTTLQIESDAYSHHGEADPEPARD